MVKLTYAFKLFQESRKKEKNLIYKICLGVSCCLFFFQVGPQDNTIKQIEQIIEWLIQETCKFWEQML